MSGLLLERSLIGMAWCPFCHADVVLGHARPRDAAQPSRWVCEHMGPIRRYPWGWTDTPHRWETLGPIEIRPVWQLHVEVTVPAPPDRTTSSAAHTGAAATTTAATTPRTADAAAATNTRRAAAGPPHRRR